jgi:hypothetical protein
MDRFSSMTPQQVLAEARKQETHIDRLNGVIEAQKWVTDLADALLAVPYKALWQSLHHPVA